MGTFQTLIFSLLLTTLAYSHTPKAGNIHGTLGPNIYATEGAWKTKLTSPYDYGIGLMAEGDVDANGGVEISLFYLNKKYYLHQADGNSIVQVKRMSVLTGYRHWFNQHVSAGLGITSSYSMGDTKVVHNATTVNSVPSTADHPVEYSLDPSVRLDLFEDSNWNWSIDLRYSWSFSRQPRESKNLLTFFSGVKYLIPKSMLNHDR